MNPPDSLALLADAANQTKPATAKGLPTDRIQKKKVVSAEKDNAKPQRSKQRKRKAYLRCKLHFNPAKRHEVRKE